MIGKISTEQASGSEGITEGNGTQGSITGSIDSDNYLNGLSSVRGGVDFSLAGRSLARALPVISCCDGFSCSQ